MVEFQTVLFYGFAAVLVAAAVGVITVRNPIYAALLLVVSFISGAVLWMLLEAEFLAIALVLVYVGAVMVLFLFVIMMLDINLEVLREGFWRYLPLGGAVGAVLLWFIISTLVTDAFGPEAFPDPEPLPAGHSNTKEIGRLLYTDYVYPFQLAAVTLLIAIVSAIVVTLRRRPGNRNVDPAWQVRVTAKERIRVLKIPPATAVAAAAPETEGGGDSQSTKGEAA